MLLKILLNVLTGVFAVVMILFGVIALISPIPFGFIFIALGLILLGVVAPPVRPLLRWLRFKWPWLDRRLDKAQDDLPEAIAEPLKASDPCADSDGE